MGRAIGKGGVGYHAHMMPEADPIPPPTDVAALLRWAAERLPQGDSRREAELLLEHALDVSRAWLFMHARDQLEAAAVQRYAALIERRRSGEPIAYILGRAGFWTLDLDVSPATLIPRPETELLVEAALEHLAPAGHARIADLGTGSGAIALALASERPQASVIATDASHDALRIAQANAQRLRLRNVAFRHGDWFAPLAGERFDLIASNPPYIEERDPHLQRGDLRFEPAAALSSGADGLDALRHISTHAPAHLSAGGWLLLEHGFDQGTAVRQLLQDAGFVDVHTRQDLEARDRVTLGRTPPGAAPRP